MVFLFTLMTIVIMVVSMISFDALVILSNQILAGLAVVEPVF